ncbi:MAG TPA: hypothetical protein VGG75_03865 [Trebonia sp.]|jgi:hypothetical protein
MGRPAYWPADTSQPLLDLTVCDLLREAAADTRAPQLENGELTELRG